MPIKLIPYLDNPTVQATPHALFVYGDNTLRKGLGGQAQIRHNNNAIGLVTKRAPTNAPEAFLTDSDLTLIEMMNRVRIRRLEERLQAQGTIYWPTNGIGTGRAALGASAPKIARYYELVFLRLMLLDTEATDYVNPQETRPCQ